MIIEKIKLENWCQHELLVEDTESSVMGVIGKNGSGKTTLLESIFFAFTGITQRKQEKYIRNGCESATVEIVFTKDGKRGKIHRKIGKGASRKIEWGDTVYTKAKEVDQLIASIFDANKDVMNNAIFIAQGAISTFIKGTQAAREDVFSKLVDVAYLDNRASVLSDKEKKLRERLVDYTFSYDTALSNAKQRSDYYLHCKEELSKLDDKSTSISDVELILQYKNSIDVSQSSINFSKGDIREAESKKAKICDDLKKVHNVISSEIVTCDNIDTLIKNAVSRTSTLKINNEEFYTSIANAEKREETLKEIKIFQEKKKKYESNLEAFNEDEFLKLKEDYDAVKIYHESLKSIEEKRKLKNDLSSTYAKGYLESNKINSSINSLREKNLNLEKELFLLEKKKEFLEGDVDVDSCPVCGSEIDASILGKEAKNALIIDIENIKNNIAGNQKEIADLVALSESYSEKLPVINNTISRYSTEIENLSLDVGRCEYAKDYDLNKLSKEIEEKQKLKDSINTTLKLISDCAQNIQFYESKLASIPVVNEDIESLKLTIYANKNSISQLEKFVEDLSSRSLILRNISTTIDVCSKNIENMKEKQSDLQDKLSSLCAQYPTENSNYEDFLLKLKEEQESHTRAKAKFDEADKELKIANQHLNEIKINVEKDAEVRKNIEVLSAVRKVLSRGGLPLSYMEKLFSQVAKRTQSILNNLDANFSVDVSKDRPLSFSFTRTDKQDYCSMEQDQLSGGQEIRLSIAFLLACQELLFPSVGFLVLDEPSEHVDAEGVESLKNLFTSLQKLLKNNDTQIWVVDHNEILTTSFNRKIIL